MLGGFRLLDIEATTDWNLATVTGTGPGGATATFPRSGSTEKSGSIWGRDRRREKRRVKLGEGNWFANYYADVGGGSSTFTWQGVAGVGYAFRWGEIIFDYRIPYHSQSGDKLIDNISFGGFAFRRELPVLKEGTTSPPGLYSTKV